jgi:hypothetical protein
VSPRVRFEDEADAEYHLAGRWYEMRRADLGTEFLDAGDAAIGQILDLPNSGSLLPRLPTDLPVRRTAVRRFPYHVVYLETKTDAEPRRLGINARRLHAVLGRCESRVAQGGSEPSGRGRMRSHQLRPQVFIAAITVKRSVLIKSPER